jgi:hypothetical protein
MLHTTAQPTLTGLQQADSGNDQVLSQPTLAMHTMSGCTPPCRLDADPTGPTVTLAPQGSGEGVETSGDELGVVPKPIFIVSDCTGACAAWPCSNTLARRTHSLRTGGSMRGRHAV